MDFFVFIEWKNSFF